MERRIFVWAKSHASALPALKKRRLVDLDSYFDKLAIMFPYIMMMKVVKL